ncbi:MerR family transcriptional regulator [Schaalia georgiae]|nr:MerR family transcriptional regulator [Schaalia georgiae]
MVGRSGSGGEAVTFVISVAAELAGMHPQTLRQYDRLGLVVPARTKGRGRRYTKQDIQRLRDVQRMSQDEGINLEGIRRILELERRVEALEAERARMRAQLAEAEMRRNRVFAASPTGEVRPMRRGERPWAGGGARRVPRALLPAPLVAVRAVIEGAVVPERR